MRRDHTATDDVLNALTDALPFLGLVLSEDGEFVEVVANDQTRELLYDDGEDLLGMTLEDVFPPARAEEFTDVIQRAIETDETQHHEYELAVDAGMKQFMGHVAPLSDESGQASHVTWVAEDITRRVEADRDRQRQYEHLIRTEKLASVGGWEYVPETDTLRWTDGAKRIFEVDSEFSPTINQALDFYHEDDHEMLWDAYHRCLRDGVSYAKEARIVTARGRQRWVSTRGERVTVDGTPKLLGSMQDITAHKTQSQRLMVLNRVLRHNLRNKLNAVLGYADLVKQETTPAADRYVGTIKTNAGSLLSLADKSRQFERVLQHEEGSDPVHFERLVAELCAEHRDRHPEATVETHLESVGVEANEIAIRVLFDELLDNALKHSDRDAPTVEIEVARQQNNRVSITVADDGPGIPEIERVAFDQVEESALHHSEGMGLWIVNWLVQTLDGGMSVQANEPRGTRVRVLLPVRQQAGDQPSDDGPTL